MDDTRDYGGLEAADDVEALTRVIEELRDELDGLRTALRYRAVIEQAKGVLTAVTGDEPDAAFRRMVQRSQRSNRRLTQVAAGIVAQAIRMPASARPDGSSLMDDADPAALEEQLVGAAFVAAGSGATQLARAVLDELDDLGVTTVALTATGADASLRLLAYEGPHPQSAVGWERIPLTADVPLADAAVTGRDVLLPDAASRIERYPGSRRLRDRLEASASLRLLIGHRCVGVLGLGWTVPMEFDDDVSSRLRSVATKLAPHVARHASAPDGRRLSDPMLESGYDPAFRALIRLLGRPVAFLEPVIDEQELLVDLRLEHANPEAAAELAVAAGDRLLAGHPRLASSGLLERARQVLTTGRLAVEPPASVVGPSAPGGATVEERLAAARLGRVGSLLVAVWEPAPSPGPEWPD